MKDKIKIKVPTDWSGVTLAQYLKFQKDLTTYIESGEEDEEYYFSILLKHFCGITNRYIKQIPADDLLNIKNDLLKFINKTDHDLKTIIKVNGKEYGFVNLSKITYGEYLDLTRFDKLSIDENWNQLMSILYRPIVKKKKYFYEIQNYTSEEDNEVWKNITMDIHFGALTFFLRLSQTLVNFTLNSLPKELDKLKKNKKIMRKNGVRITQYTNYATEILTKWKKS